MGRMTATMDRNGRRKFKKSIFFFDTRTQIITGHSVASAYLSPDVLRRPNLAVAVNITVEKILFSTSCGAPRAIGVQVATSAEAPKYRVTAHKEVVLCGGVIGSPQILFVSGIGCADELKAAAVPMVKDIRAVGKHLTDVSLYLGYSSNPSFTVRF